MDQTNWPQQHSRERLSKPDIKCLYSFQTVFNILTMVAKTDLHIDEVLLHKESTLTSKLNLQHKRMHPP